MREGKFFNKITFKSLEENLKTQKIFCLCHSHRHPILMISHHLTFFLILLYLYRMTFFIFLHPNLGGLATINSNGIKFLLKLGCHGGGKWC